MPASYLPTATPPGDVHEQRSRRARVLGDRAPAAGSARPRERFRLEAELAYAHATHRPAVADPRRRAHRARDVEPARARGRSPTSGSRAARLGLDGGYASGDDAPGFGAFPQARRRGPHRRRVRRRAGQSTARPHRRQLPVPPRLPRSTRSCSARSSAPSPTRSTCARTPARRCSPSAAAASRPAPR